MKRKLINLLITNLDKWAALDNLGITSLSNNKLWVSASKTKNYLLRDPLLDWLDEYYVSHVHTNSNNNLQILFDKGNEFESLIFKELKHKFKNDFQMVCHTRDDMLNRDNFNKTKDYMKKNIPIIAQAMLCNNDNMTYGTADLLVRTDYLNKIFKNPPVTENIGREYYVVIDIKWSSIPLKANGLNILNSGLFMSYKGQLAIYNLALGKEQGYIPDKTFILGKSVGDHCNSFNQLAEIDYNDIDNEYIELTSKAVKWIRDMRLYGHTWDVYNPSRIEMYPNMCNQLDGRWGKTKSKIAESIKELTSIWQVNYKNRQVAHNNNIYTWNNPNCNSKSLNINGKIIAPTVNKILDMNRTENDKLMIPDKIKNNIHNWKQKEDIDFFIDFETFNECLMKSNKINIYNSKAETCIIFMIGLGYMDNNEFKFKSFVMKHYSLEEEKRIITECIDFIKFISKNRTPKLFHWSSAETTFLNISNNRHNQNWDIWLKNVNLVDLYKIFVDEPIIIKGMKRFKLKEVANIMAKYGMIKTSWDTEISDGLSAMIEAVKFYDNLELGQEYNPDIINKISEYNKIDCTVMYEILEYLRQK